MPTSQRTPLPAGTRLNHDTYRIEAMLGAGGFGITYRAHDENLDRPIALKEFFPVECCREGLALAPSGSWTEADLADYRQKFLEEGRSLARLTHPGIVKVYAVFRENATV